MSADRIAELERLLAEATQRIDEEKQRAEEEKRLADEAKVRAEEEKRLADEAKVRAEEEKRRADREAEGRREEKLRADREAEARRDAQAFIVNLEHRLLQSEQIQNRQPLRDYLRQVSRLHAHLSRMLPFLPESRHLTSVHEASGSSTESSRGRSSGSSPKTTTAGMTSIKGKFYPLRVRPWTDFLQMQSDMFRSLADRLGDNAVFPSQSRVRMAEETLQKKIPSDFVDTESFHNHQRTTSLLDIILEDPSSSVVEKYLAARPDDHVPIAIFFDNAVHTVRAATNPRGRTRDGNTTAAADESTTGSSNPDVSLDSGASDTAGNAAEQPTQKLPEQTRPDCVVMVRDLLATDSMPNPPPRRLLVGEHKPCHAMRAADIGNNSTALPEDCLLRMAVAESSRKAKLSSGRNQSSGRSRGRSNPRPATRVDGPVPKTQIIFAYALAQTYHYMLSSGLEYGYLASGETLTCLRIPHDEPTTLLYHTAVFPAVDPKDLPQKGGRPIYPSNVTDTSADEGEHANDTDALAQLAVAQLSSLALLAYASTPRSPSWVTKAVVHLAEFPNLPASHRRPSASPLGLRRRGDDTGDGDDGDDGDDAGNGGGSGGAGRRGQSRRRLRSEAPGGDIVVPSPLRQVHDAHPSHRDSGDCDSSSLMDATTAESMADLPFCTQACLLGLVRGLPLDPACPNYPTHKQAAAVASTQAPETMEDKVEQRHAITRAQLCEKIRAQIHLRPENGCLNLYDQGYYGSVGCLLKLTALGYGYTFVAKAVERTCAYRLRRESRIYQHLHPLQGTLIPVYLGCFRLKSAYPLMVRFTTLTHVLLVSYTGETLHSGDALDKQSARLGRDLANEIDDTYDELAEWGLDDTDVEVTNATWCAETQRVVKIDFDHCHLDTVVCAAKAKDVANEGPAVAETVASAKTQQPTPMTPMSDIAVFSEAEVCGNGADDGADGTVRNMNDPAAKHGRQDPEETRQGKRARHD